MYSSTLLIEELNSAGDTTTRSVTLVGPSLPFMGAEWAGENNLKTTWYNGNGDEATQQVLGPRELPSTWQGDWRRTMMGQTPTPFVDDNGSSGVYVNPKSLADFLEAIFRGGQRLRVTWIVDGPTTDQQGKQVREGRARTWKFKFTRLQDIEWEVTFDWVGRGKATQKVASTRDDNLAAATAGLNAAIANLVSLTAAAGFINSKSTIPFSSQSLTLGQLETFVNGPLLALKSFTRSIQQALSNVQRIGDLANSIASLPFAIANQAIDFARNTIAQSNTFLDRAGRTPPELLSLSTKVSDMTRAATYYNANKRNALTIARKSQEFALKIRARAGIVGLQGRPTNQSVQMRTQDVLAVYVTKTGDTPQRISQRFYKSPDHGPDILRANRLPLYQPSFPSGKPIIIPVLQTNTRGT